MTPLYDLNYPGSFIWGVIFILASWEKQFIRVCENFSQYPRIFYLLLYQVLSIEAYNCYQQRNKDIRLTDTFCRSYNFSRNRFISTGFLSILKNHV